MYIRLGEVQCAIGYSENSGLSSVFLGMFKHDFHSVSLHTGVGVAMSVGIVNAV